MKNYYAIEYFESHCIVYAFKFKEFRNQLIRKSNAHPLSSKHFLVKQARQRMIETAEWPVRIEYGGGK